MEQVVHCCSTRANGRLTVLKNQVKIAKPPLDTEKRPKPDDETFDKHPYEAIWDTGATNTAITSKVVQECDLRPIGVAKISTAGGDHTSHRYLVDIILPNRMGVFDVEVSEVAEIRDADVLIGMDIIGSGDFAVTNYDGKTVFTFRYPSVGTIDFVEESPKEPKVGRNQPCPCGSGKKYKFCHGK